MNLMGAIRTHMEGTGLQSMLETVGGESVVMLMMTVTGKTVLRALQVTFFLTSADIANL